MTDISKLRGITPDEEAKLRSGKTEADGITTVDALWERVGGDIDHGIARVAFKKDLSKKRLTELLLNQALYESEVQEDSWLRQYWLELILVEGLVILVLAVLWMFGVL